MAWRPNASRASRSTSPTASSRRRRRRFILADTPGHQQYTRNMVTGASTADLAILLIDARKGILPQTRRHAAIASLLGIRQVVLAVNKMDLVGFDEAVFATIRHDFRALLGKLEFDRDHPDPDLRPRRRQRHRGQRPDALVHRRVAAAGAGEPPTPRVRADRRRSACRCSTSTAPTTRSAAMPAPSRPGACGPATAGQRRRPHRSHGRPHRHHGRRSGRKPAPAIPSRWCWTARSTSPAATSWPPIPRPPRPTGSTAWVVWMDETPLFRGRAYLLMLGTPHRGRDGHRHHHPPGHGDAGGNQRARTRA